MAQCVALMRSRSTEDPGATVASRLYPLSHGAVMPVSLRVPLAMVVPYLCHLGSLWPSWHHTCIPSDPLTHGDIVPVSLGVPRTVVTRGVPLATVDSCLCPYICRGVGPMG